MARKEDIMVPGITDTECRMAELRYQERLMEADGQRRAASAVLSPANHLHVIETLLRCIGEVTEQVRHLIPGGRSHEVSDPTAAPGTLAVN
jgi:hypothetical protein